MEEKSAKKLDMWQGNSLAIAGRTTLINSSLVNSTIYHMSMYLLPKTVIKTMDKGRRKFFWQGQPEKEVSPSTMEENLQIKEKRGV
jgi:hypothetical protein